MASPYIQIIIFSCLNAVLWCIHGSHIPRLDVFLTLLVALSVLLVRVVTPWSSQKMKIIETKQCKRFKPILLLSELVVFLIVPWALLLVTSSENSDMAGHILSSHLYYIQTQIALEFILTDGGRGRRTFFPYGEVTTLLRGIGIARWISRYIAVRRDFQLSYATALMDIYSFMAIVVWLGANAFIVFAWRTCPMILVNDSGLRTYKDTVVIITGAASGIGRALAENVARRGAKAVVLVDRQKTLAEKVAAELKGAETLVYTVDVRDYNQVKRVVNETKERFGRIDYMFNNAGILIIGPIEQIGVENFDYIFDVNVKGVHHGVQAVYPIMKEQGYGHIVNTSSLLGLIPGGQWAVAYSASKHAVVGLTTNLRIEAAKDGIQVSLFCPGTIETPIHTGGAYGKNLTGIPKEIWDKQLAKMKAMDAKSCAEKTLDDVAKNKAIIVVPELPMMTSRLLYRLSPSLWLERAVSKNDWRKGLQKKAPVESSMKKDE